MIRQSIIITLCLALLLIGCQPHIPPEALQLNEESLKQRQLQTRVFDTSDEITVLSACSALLQDMGFNLDESETHLGIMVGSKDRSAVNAGQVAGAILLAFMGVSMPIDSKQKMRACIVTKPVGEKQERIAVRVTFQRIVWNTQNQVSKREGLTDEAMYSEFFEKLSKSIFLEAHQL